ncbi:DUF2178 domain-containing protein [Fictibacillus fluitans]|uniref:DUF2178 domain-containing protein n=1 Tax=Fictibacillus fluitans TaxID=3058422 RepID=A0ABT8HWA2_9BACL|nr:DUF2178 domain-containing protein [Fictibacillus sp. NE201]MDN4525004.1 DUF2178 domain-containing protein [Fictibacillus sp. NE201]
MQVNVMTVIIGAIVGLGAMTLITGQFQWGFLTALLIITAGFKWLRIEKQKARDEIEYDERINDNIKQTSLQIFSFSNLLLFIYLLVVHQLLNKRMIQVDYLMIYLVITFLIAFYLVPLIARKR